MKFKRGSKVEVMNKKLVPISWRSAEILGGNGHTYSVRYDYDPGINSGSMMERVSRKLVRPCPPPSQGVVTWEVGDIVEVFEDLSWKIATILKVMQGDYYMVRLLGCSVESNIHKLNTREQRLWLDDKWILMGKSSGSCAANQVNKLPSSNFNEKRSFQAAESNPLTQVEAQKNCLDSHKNPELQDLQKVSSRCIKRMSPYCSSVIESFVGHAQKIRAVEKDSRKQKVALPSSMEKVDAVAYPRELLGETYMQAYFNKRMSGHNEQKRKKLDGTADSCLDRSLESNVSDSDVSSVGSCSVISVEERRLSCHFAHFPCQVTDGVCSDAESSSSSTDDEESCSLPLVEEREVVASVHNMELHAYHRTLEALHASGPLSWELETLLTNLRVMLHISDDEHLIEVLTYQERKAIPPNGCLHQPPISLWWAEGA